MKKILLSIVLLLPAFLFSQGDQSQAKYQVPEKSAVTLYNNSSHVSAHPDETINNEQDLKFAIFPRTSKMEQHGSFNVFPNPAIWEASVVFKAYENGLDYNLVMSGSDGKTVLAKKGTTVYGTNLVKLDIHSFPTGFYYILFTTKTGRQQMKLIKNAY